MTTLKDYLQDLLSEHLTMILDINQDIDIKSPTPEQLDEIVEQTLQNVKNRLIG